MGAVIYLLAFVAAFGVVAYVLWLIGPKEPSSEDDQSDNQW